MVCRPAARGVLPLGLLPGAPWLALLLTTRLPSMNTTLPSSLSERNWYVPAVVMLMKPVQRAAMLLVPTLAYGANELTSMPGKLTDGVRAVTVGVRLPIQ